MNAAAAVAQVRTTAISGHLYSDSNNDGLIDGQDTPLVGITVYLDTNHNGVHEANEPARMTNTQGFYAFTGLPAGTYFVTQIMPAGFVLTTPTAVFTEKLQLNQPAVADFGLSNSTAIVGKVFQDLHGDGQAQAADLGVARQVVYLDANRNGQLDQTSTSFAGASGQVGSPYDDAHLDNFCPVNLAGIAGQITHLTVSVDVRFAADNNYQGFSLFLLSPSGEYIQLTPDQLPGSGLFGITFDDDAAFPIEAFAAPGSYRPLEALSRYTGVDPNGTWYLVTYDTSQAGGSVDRWSLNVTTATEQFSTSDSLGNYSLVGLAPGNYLVATVVPAGMTQSFPQAAETAVAGGIGQLTRLDFGDRRTNAIDGLVVRDLSHVGVANQVVYLDGTGTGVYSGFQFSDNDVPIPIPPVSPGGGGSGFPFQDVTTSTITIAGVDQPINDMKTFLDLAFPNDGYLFITLTSPGGTTIILSSFEGYQGADFSGTIFDDDAATSIAQGTAPFAGHFQPDELLAAFDGESANGVWTLTITNYLPDFVGAGALTHWGLVFNNTWIDPVAITDAFGRYRFVNVAPGTYTVGILPSAGFAVSAPVGASQRVILDPEGLVDVDFGLRPRDSVVGTIFRDLDGNGTQDDGEVGVAGITVFDDLNGNGQLDSASSVFASTDVPIAVDAGDHAEIRSTTTVLGALPNLSHLSVTLTLTFPDPNGQGLWVFLVSPSGTKVRLSGAGLPGPGFINTTFDDSASTIIYQGNPPYTGTFRPYSPLAAFNGEDPNGVWTLVVINAFLASGDAALMSWSLNVTATEPTTTTDATGHYELDHVPSGVGAIIALPPAGLVATGPTSGVPVTLTPGDTGSANVSIKASAPPRVVDIVAHWGVQSLSIFGMNRDLPWSTLSSIDIVFDRNVAVDPSFFRLIGSSFGDDPVTMSYNALTYTVTLRIAAGTAFTADRVTLSILSDATAMVGVQDNPGGKPGNYLLGGDFLFSFAVLPGDVGGRGVVNVLDALAIRTDILSGVYEYLTDLDGDGVVDVNDYLIARKKNGNRIV